MNHDGSEENIDKGIAKKIINDEGILKWEPRISEINYSPFKELFSYCLIYRFIIHTISDIFESMNVFH